MSYDKGMIERISPLLRRHGVDPTSTEELNAFFSTIEERTRANEISEADLAALVSAYLDVEERYVDPDVGAVIDVVLTPAPRPRGVERSEPRTPSREPSSRTCAEPSADGCANA